MVLFNACTGSKKIAKPDPVDNTAIEAFDLVKGNALEFDQFNVKADLDIKSSMFSGGAKLQLRMVKDSALWFSVNKFGVEVARGLITVDSIQAVERLQRTYVRMGIDEASEMAGFNLRFGFLQDFILGNPYLDEEENPLQVIGRDTLQVSPIMDEYDIKHLFYMGNGELLSTTLEDNATKITTIITFSDYESISPDDKFSYFRNIYLDTNDSEQTELSIKFSKPEINQKKALRFSIPDSYTARQL